MRGLKLKNMRGDRAKVIVEEYINFISEITILTVRQKNGNNFLPSHWSQAI